MLDKIKVKLVFGNYTQRTADGFVTHTQGAELEVSEVEFTKLGNKVKRSDVIPDARPGAELKAVVLSPTEKDLKAMQAIAAKKETPATPVAPLAEPEAPAAPETPAPTEQKQTEKPSTAPQRVVRAKAPVVRVSRRSK